MVPNPWARPHYQAVAILEVSRAGGGQCVHTQIDSHKQQDSACTQLNLCKQWASAHMHSSSCVNGEPVHMPQLHEHLDSAWAAEQHGHACTCWPTASWASSPLSSPPRPQAITFGDCWFKLPSNCVILWHQSYSISYFQEYQLQHYEGSVYRLPSSL